MANVPLKECPVRVAAVTATHVFYTAVANCSSDGYIHTCFIYLLLSVAVTATHVFYNYISVAVCSNDGYSCVL